MSNYCSVSENLGLKSIGRAGKAVTKQLGKTLTSMSDTPDNARTQETGFGAEPSVCVKDYGKRPKSSNSSKE